MNLEPIEARTLLAGVTVITHGFEDTTTGWVSTMADAIADRAGGRSAVAIYTLNVGLDNSGNLAVLGLVHQSNTASITTASSGETIIKLNWFSVSDGSFSTVQVGDVVAAWMMSAPTVSGEGELPALDELPIHFIGHSRGASLNTEIAKDLGEHDIWVDQFTSLDPHPVNGGSNNIFGANFGDEPMKTWSNIVFADDYWRTDGDGQSIDPNGLPVAGADIQSLAASVQANHGAGSAHDAVHAWYFGTIKPHAISDGDGIDIPSSWYGHTSALPARMATGFADSLIGGDTRPASGTAVAFGGSAARVDPGQSGTQWADVGQLSLETSNITAGRGIKIKFAQEDRQPDTRVTFYLDTDRNPYDGNTLRSLASETLTQNNSVVSDQIKGGTSNVAPGKYYVYARITTTNGQTRYAYARQAVTITGKVKAGAD